MSAVIRKRLKQENEKRLKRQHCQTLTHMSSCDGHSTIIPDLFGLKKKKRDEDADYYDLVTHAIDPVALRAGFKSKIELNKIKIK